MEQRSGWVNAAAKIAGTGLSFLLLAALARSMTPEAFADFAVVFAWVILATVVVGSSLPLLTLRFVAENLARGRADLARGIANFSLAVTTSAAVVVAGVAALLLFTGVVDLPRDLGATGLVAAGLLPPGVALLVLAGILQGLKRVTAAELLSNALRPALALAALGAVVLTHGLPLSTPSVYEIYLAATWATLAACAVFTAWAVPPEMSRARATYTPRVWIHASFAFLAVMVAAALNERIDLLVMGIAAPPAKVAVYAVAARFAQTVFATVNASSAVMAPRLVERLPQLEAGEWVSTQLLVRSTARTMVAVSLVALVALALAGPWLLKLFGPSYSGALVPLLVLVAGQVVAALFGPAVAVATFVGRTRLAVASLVAGILTNAGLNLALVPSLGALGAALATATGMTVAAVVGWALVSSALHLDTSVFAPGGPPKSYPEADPRGRPGFWLRNAVGTALVPFFRAYVRYVPGRALKAWLWRGFIGPKLSWRRYRTCAMSVFGSRFRIDTYSLVQRYIYYFGIWEPHLTRWIQSRLKPGDVFVDIGANVGYFTLLASRLVGPEGRVLAIEASPEIHAQLQANVAGNDARNVRTVNVAVAEVPGELTLFPGDALTTTSPAWAELKHLPRGPSVPALPLPDILEPSELGRVRFVKIDVEGGEWSVVQGMVGMLERLPPDAEVMVEVTPVAMQAHGKTMDDLVLAFAQRGFHAYRITNDYTPRDYLGPLNPHRPSRLRGSVDEQMDIIFARADRESL